MIALALTAIIVAAVCGTLGFWAGVRVTARNADRLLAVMNDTELVTLARKTRARRELLGSASEPPPEPKRPERTTRPPSEGFETRPGG